MDKSKFNPTDITARKKREVKKEQEETLRTEQYEEDFRWLMERPQGRRFVWALLSKTGTFSNPFTGDSRTFFRCGEMNVGQRLLADIMNICPEHYVQMVHDNRKVKSNDD